MIGRCKVKIAINFFFGLPRSISAGLGKRENHEINIWIISNAIHQKDVGSVMNQDNKGQPY